MNTKQCSKCIKVKSTDRFKKDKQKKDGLDSSCKDCRHTYYKDNQERILKNAASYYVNNKSEISKRIKKYHQYNRGSILEQRKQYRIDNKTTIKESNRKYYEKNPGVRRAQSRRRWAKKRNINECYTPEDEITTLTAFDNKCFKCSSAKDLCVDHHRPLSKGHALTPDNAVILCRVCNSSKGAKPPEEFYGIKICKLLDNKLTTIKKIKEIVKKWQK